MIYALFEHLNKDFEIIKILPQKPTARCPFSAIVAVDGEKKLVVIANTDIQKFYLKRSIEKQREFYDDFSPYFQFNFPDTFGDLNDFSYAIYPYLENVKWCKDKRPLEIVKKIYKQYAKRYIVNAELIEKIEKDFLSSWPLQFHKEIQTLPLYQKYFSELTKKKTLFVYKEHCDYTVNNVLDDGKKLWLMDFEFSKTFQPIGHDKHDFIRTRKSKEFFLSPLVKIKEKLMDEINDLVDKNV